MPSLTTRSAEGGHLEWTTMAPHLDSRHVVFLADIILLVLLFLIVLWRLPRAIARFSHKSAWTNGHCLKYQSASNSLPNSMDEKRYSLTSKHTKTDSSSTTNSAGVPVMNQTQTVVNFPAHCPSSPRILRPVSLLLQTRLVPGFTSGQTILLGFYLFFLLWVSLYESNPFTDALREGWLVMAQVPFVIAFATKNNIYGSLVGLGYEKLNFAHRFMARLLVIWANIHTLGYIYHWASEGTFYEHASTVPNIWGFVVFAAMNIMWFFSTEFWRKKAYRVFQASHVLVIVIFLPGVWYHNPSQMPYLVFALLLYGIDRIVRAVKSRIAEARIQAIPELQCTRVVIPRISGGWAAGQHVRLRVLSSCMGPFGWLEIHPFTIASVAETPEGMVLMCKNAGSWTNRLYNAAASGTDGENGPSERKVRVHVEGPYGGTGHTVIPSYSGAMIVAGGSGISFALSIVQDILRKDQSKVNRVKNVDLVWIIQNPACLKPLIPTFSTMLSHATETQLRISVYYTRHQHTDKKLPFNNDVLPQGLTLTTGRPNLSKILSGTLTDTISLPGGAKDADGLKGVILGCCGPLGLGDDSAKAVNSISCSRMAEVGGVELHEEVFEW